MRLPWDVEKGLDFFDAVRYDFINDALRYDLTEDCLLRQKELNDGRDSTKNR